MANTSLSQTAYDALLARLLDGRLAPGALIDRKILAGELGMSVSPVVDALSRLAGEGMVEILPRRATRVRSVTPAVFREQIIYRTALETQAARLSCGAPVRAEYARLKAMCERIEQLPYSPDLWRSEAEFHLALAELSGADMLVEALRRLLVFAHFAASHMIIADDNHRRKHQPLLDALCSDDPDVAAAAVRHHMAVAREAVLRHGAVKSDVIL